MPSSAHASSPDVPTPVIPEADAYEARRLVAEGALLLDVREVPEWRAGHAPQAIHVPLRDLPRADQDGWSGRTIVVVCRSGNRSALATGWLRQQGFDAVNLAGGMLAWHAAGGPVVAVPEGPGRVV